MRATKRTPAQKPALVAPIDLIKEAFVSEAKADTKRKPRKPRLALSGTAEAVLRGADLANLHELRFGIHDVYNFWIGAFTEAHFDRITDKIPILANLVDLHAVRRRIQRGKVSLQEGFPELNELYNRCGATIANSKLRPPQKADAWIRAVASDASADVSVEAATYLARTGRAPTALAELVAERWEWAIMRDIARGKGSAELRARADAGTLTLTEAASTLDDLVWNPRFMGFRDREEFLIDAAMLRAMDALELTQFEPWARTFVQQLTDGPTDGVDHFIAGAWLFATLRSDYALRTAELDGLKTWIRTFAIGPHERDLPWRFFSGNGYDDSYLIAAEFAFAAGRVGQAVASGTVDAAIKLVLSSQKDDGSWQWSKEKNVVALYTTCCAVHALAVLKPDGWQRACARAAQWLWRQQNDLGYWHDGIAEFDTVLVLDSISLAETGRAVTLDVAASPVDPVLGPVTPVPWPRIDVTSDRRDRIVAAVRELQETLAEEDVPVFARPTSLVRNTRALEIRVVDEGGFLISVPERTGVLTRAMLDAWLQQPDDTAALVAQLTVLHEVYHHRQNLESTTYAGIGRAGVALEEVDSRADAVAAGTVARWKLRRAGVTDDVRAVVVPIIEAIVVGVETFDHLEQGGRIQRLYERRLRRYLAWCLQVVRARTIHSLRDLETLLDERLVIARRWSNPARALDRLSVQLSSASRKHERCAIRSKDD